MNIKKVFLGTVVGLTTALFSVSSSFAFEEINGYTFQDDGLVGLKVTNIDDGKDESLKGAHIVSLALRTLSTDENTAIDSLDTSIYLDGSVWDLDKLANNLDDYVKVDEGVFTNIETIDAEQLKNNYFKFTATTNVGYKDSTPADVLSFVVYPKEDNTTPETKIKIDDVTTRILDTKVDPQANLFTGELSVTTEVSVNKDAVAEEVPVEKIEEDVKEEVTIEEPTTNEVEVKEVKEEVKKVETGATENILILLFSAFFLGSAYIVRKKA